MGESAGTLAVADYAIIAGFFVVMLAIGFYFSGKMRTLQDYFSGGRMIPWWLSAVSFYMSTFSAFTFVSYSALAYQYGWPAVTIFWVTVPSSILGAYFFAARWRRAALTSPLEYIEERFGPALRQCLAWLGIPVKVIDDGLKLYAIGTLVSVGLNFSLAWGVFLSGSIMLVYTFLGGLWAVIVTDFVQFVVMFAAVMVLVPLSLAKVGGAMAFFQNIPPHFYSFTSEKYNWTYLASFFVIIALNYSTSWSLVQKYYSVKTDADARKVGYAVAVLNIFGPPIFFLPAMAARLYLPQIENVNDVYAVLCRTLLPVGMIGMLIAAMFSATMSMISSDYNSMAAVLTNDVYKRFISRAASQRSLVFVGRLATLLVGLLSLVIARVVMNHPGEGDLFQLMVRLYSLFLPPIAIPMLAGLLSPRVSNTGGMAGLLSGMGMGLCLYFLGSHPDYAFLRKEQIITVCTVLTTLIGLVLGTYLRPGSSRQKERIQRFFEHMESPESSEDQTPYSPFSDFTPLSIIGYSIASLGLLLMTVIIFTARGEGGGLSLVVGFGMVVVGSLFLWRRKHES